MLLGVDGSALIVNILLVRACPILATGRSIIIIITKTIQSGLLNRLLFMLIFHAHPNGAGVVGGIRGDPGTEAETIPNPRPSTRPN